MVVAKIKPNDPKLKIPSISFNMFDETEFRILWKEILLNSPNLKAQLEPRLINATNNADKIDKR